MFPDEGASSGRKEEARKKSEMKKAMDEMRSELAYHLC